MAQLDYSTSIYKGSDFIGPVSKYDFHFFSGAPQTRNNFFTLFRPFDQYVWGLIIASVVAVSLTLITVNMMHNKLSMQPLEETPFQSKKIVCHLVCDIKKDH